MSAHDGFSGNNISHTSEGGKAGNQPSKTLNASYTRKAGQTIAFRTPSTPIQKVEAVEMNQTAAPITPKP